MMYAPASLLRSPRICSDACSGVQRLAPFHVSSRYEGCEEQLLEEAAAAFGGPVVRLPAGPAAS